MIKPEKELTREDMTEILYIRAEEIFLLSALATRRGLAHAFCELSGHVQALSARVTAVDTVYQNHSWAKIAEIDVRLHLDYYEDSELAAAFRSQMREMDTYAAYLKSVIEKGELVLTEMTEGAA